MSARLVRALQRGGCTVECANGKWAVWRGPDRRGKAIGELKGADVEMLRLRGDLALAGGMEDGRLVWVGPVEVRTEQPVSPAAMMDERGPVSRPIRPLLQRLLEDHTKPPERRRLAQAARDFSEDMSRSHSSGWASGMNWQAIKSGTRVEGSANISQQDGRIGHALSSTKRLQHLNQLLEPSEFRLLEKLIIEFETRQAIARWQGLRPRQSELRALRALRRLADIYDQRIKQPPRARPPLT